MGFWGLKTYNFVELHRSFEGTAAAIYRVEQEEVKKEVPPKLYYVSTRRHGVTTRRTLN